ncbi:hypothetical protein FIBSPDRAFT_529142 [Athelia psychrophila]|uniref:Uncharacterized protein n=1 Tax=Athelia psychrophila TaxID=1759441 RepID=A0A166JEM2_9AGAM|nr:hypothetical protein FIBSPDRAFT_529142 [Fibularhizoctonia sp. CBS 109695]
MLNCCTPAERDVPSTSLYFLRSFDRRASCTRYYRRPARDQLPPQLQHPSPDTNILAFLALLALPASLQLGPGIPAARHGQWRR